MIVDIATFILQSILLLFGLGVLGSFCYGIVVLLRELLGEERKRKQLMKEYNALLQKNQDMKFELEQLKMKHEQYEQDVFLNLKPKPKRKQQPK